MKYPVCLLIAFCLLSCHYSPPNIEVTEMNAATRDSLSYLYTYHYTLGTNLQLQVDSLEIACLPVKDCRYMLYKGDRVVVAQFDTHPVDSTETWVKLAHTQVIQGWIKESEVVKSFMPANGISQFIYLFSHTYAPFFVGIFALFVGIRLWRRFRHKQFNVVFINDIDTFYPGLLCVLMGVSATIYATLQMFVPETWEHFYFNPTLSPFKVPLLLSLFLVNIWLLAVVLLAALDDVFRLLPPLSALLYLLGLLSACIFCYFFFIWTTYIYVGYLFLLLLFGLFFVRLRRILQANRYRCGHCGRKLTGKGVCPKCGWRNE
ncbi:MAG: hypothetical protein LBM62_00205 [Mediterranea sp.]|jgi:hypothetical protein|nr:hypothetical protein [Mediterranea sp.]